jgi:hypothetical protein
LPGAGRRPRPEARCGTDEEDPPGQHFLKCLAEYEATMQEKVGSWSAEVEARQAAIDTKGNFAVIFGLAGVLFAVCAVAVKGSDLPGQQIAGPAAHYAGGAPMPARPPAQS